MEPGSAGASGYEASGYEAMQNRRVRQVRLMLMSDDDIRRESVVQITKPSSKIGDWQGLSDPRLGVQERGRLCPTCNRRRCDGHIGHIELFKPLWRCSHISRIVTAHRSLCDSCGRLRFLPTEEADAQAEFRLGSGEGSGDVSKGQKALSKWLAKRRTCPWTEEALSRLRGDPVYASRPELAESLSRPACGMPLAQFRIDQQYFVKRTWTPKQIASLKESVPAGLLPEVVRELTPEDSRSVFGATDEYTRSWLRLDPRLLVQHVQLVPPPAIRPAVVTKYGSLGEDDLTNLLREVIKENDSARAEDAKLRDMSPGDPGYARQKTRALVAWKELALRVVEVVNPKGTEKVHIPHIETLKGATQLRRHQRFVSQRRGIRDRLDKKGGQLRGNLMGGRVDHCARSTIDPAHPWLDIHHLGVPDFFMNKLTYPERVNALNLRRLREAVCTGARKANGATTIHAPPRPGEDPDDTATYSLETMSPEEREAFACRLDVGWVVDRHLIDEDVVMFNRQPTLFRGSWLAHYAIRVSQKSFQLHDAVTNSYNADFDGDEMNMHVPQSEMEKAEAVLQMAVDANIRGAGNNAPRIGLIMGDLHSGMTLTMPGHTFLTRAQAQQLAMEIHYDPDDESRRDEIPRIADKLPGAPFAPENPLSRPFPRPAILKAPGLPPGHRGLYTGHQVFSWLLPRDMHMRKTVRDGERLDYWSTESLLKNDGACDVRVVGGELVHGTLCKGTIGASVGGMVDVMEQDFGGRAVVRFLSDAHRLLCAFALMEGGASVSLADCVPSEHMVERARQITEQNRKSSVRFEGMRDRLGKDEVEIHSTRALTRTQVEMEAASLATVSANTNDLAKVIFSGAKGKNANIAQIMGALGQQMYNGRRLLVHRWLGGDTLDSGDPIFAVDDAADVRDGKPKRVGCSRSLVSFAPDDLGPSSRGFIDRSFATGLSPNQWVAHSIASRIGIIDTGVRTSEVGYMQRRLMTMLASVVAQADGTIRTSDGTVLTFQSGLDPTKVAPVKTPPFSQNYPVSGVLGDDGYRERWERLSGAARLVYDASRESCVSTNEPWSVLAPFHPRRVLAQFGARSRQRRPPSSTGPTDWGAVERAIAQAHARIVEAHSLQRASLSSFADVADQMLEAWGEGGSDPSLLLRACMVGWFAPSKCSAFAIDPPEVIGLWESVARRYAHAVTAGGEPVGGLSACSITEPVQQMTLNSVSRDTLVTVCLENKFVSLPVGSLVDNLASCLPVQRHPDGTEEVALPEGLLRVPTATADGSNGWAPVTAVTRHPVVNEDGTSTLVRVTTRTGRSVRVTKAKSLVRWNAETERLEPVGGAEIRVGDLVPIQRSKTVSVRQTPPEDQETLSALYRQGRALAHALVRARAIPREGRVQIPTTPYLDDLLQHGTLCQELAQVGLMSGPGDASHGPGDASRGPTHEPHVPDVLRTAVVDSWGGSATPRTVVELCLVADQSVQIWNAIHAPSGEGNDVPFSTWMWGAPPPLVEAFFDELSLRYPLEQDGLRGFRSVWSERMAWEMVSFAQHLFGWFGVVVPCATDGSLSEWGVLWTEGFMFPEDGGDAFRKNAEWNDLVLDEVVSVELDVPYDDLAFDFTVEPLDGKDESRTFSLTNGLVVFDTFHYVGLHHAVTTQGLPRIKELINMTDTCSDAQGTVFLRRPFCQNEEFVSFWARGLAATPLESVVKRMDVRHVPVSVVERLARDSATTGASSPSRAEWLQILADQGTEHMLDKGLRPALDRYLSGRKKELGMLQEDLELEDSPHKLLSDFVVDIVLRRTRLFEKGLHVRHVARALRAFWGKDAIVSEASPLEEDWVCRVRPRGTAVIACLTHELPNMDLVERMAADFARNAMRNAVVVQGDTSVKRAEVIPDPTPGHGGEFCVRTVGIQLKNVVALEEVDARRTCSSDIADVAHVLGIEAARELFEREMRRVISTYIDPRHVQILADLIAMPGVPTAANRYNLNSLGTNVMSRAAFEQSTSTLAEGAALGTTDPVTELNCNLLLGQEPRGVGTSIVDALPERAPPNLVEEEVEVVPPLQWTDGPQPTDEDEAFVGIRIRDQIVAPLHVTESERAGLWQARSKRGRGTWASEVVEEVAPIGPEDKAGDPLEWDSRMPSVQTTRVASRQTEKRMRFSRESGSNPADPEQTAESEYVPPLDSESEPKPGPKASKTSRPLPLPLSAGTPAKTGTPDPACVPQLVDALVVVEDVVKGLLQSSDIRTLDVRLGRVMPDATGASPRFVDGVAETMFFNCLSQLRSMGSWDAGTGTEEELTLDVYYDVPSIGRVRTSVDWNPKTWETTQAFRRTHVRKSAIRQEAFLCEGRPESLCVRLVGEWQESEDALPVVVEPVHARIKARSTFRKGPWMYILTKVWAGRSPIDAESAILRGVCPQYEFKLELTDPCSISETLPVLANPTTPPAILQRVSRMVGNTLLANAVQFLTTRASKNDTTGRIPVLTPVSAVFDAHNEA